MTTRQFEDPITADGDYVFPVSPTGEHIFEIAGSFGGGTATVGYLSMAGAIVAYDDGEATDDKAWDITIPASGHLVISLTGATSPSIKAYLIGK